MEFDLFEEGKIEAADSLPNSNSDDLKRETRDYYSFYERPNVVPDSEVIRQEKYTTMQQQNLENAHEQRLMKAQERRNRERRISSFTSWMPDLQRVWALKLTKTEKLMRDQLPKPSKRRKKHMATNDRVCETPFMGRKENLGALDDGSCCTASTSKPLSKALFHDNGKFDSVDIS